MMMKFKDNFQKVDSEVLMYSYNGNRVVLLLIPAKPYHHHHFELFSQAVVARAMTPQHNDAKSTKKSKVGKIA